MNQTLGRKSIEVLGDVLQAIAVAKCKAGSAFGRDKYSGKADLTR